MQGCVIGVDILVYHIELFKIDHFVFIQYHNALCHTIILELEWRRVIRLTSRGPKRHDVKGLRTSYVCQTPNLNLLQASNISQLVTSGRLRSARLYYMRLLRSLFRSPCLCRLYNQLDTHLRDDFQVPTKLTVLHSVLQTLPATHSCFLWFPERCGYIPQSGYCSRQLSRPGAYRMCYILIRRLREL